MTKKQEQELQKRIDEHFEKIFKDPAYRKAHSMELSEN